MTQLPRLAAQEAQRATAEAKMSHEMSGMLFPWERSAFGDRTEKLKWWQKAYWVGFACVPHAPLAPPAPPPACHPALTAVCHRTLLLPGV